MNLQRVVVPLTVALCSVAPLSAQVIQLSGNQVVPPTGSSASGSCTVILSSDWSRLDVSCVNDVSDVTAAHIHRGARGDSGGVVFLFSDPSAAVMEGS